MVIIIGRASGVTRTSDPLRLMWLIDHESLQPKYLSHPFAKFLFDLYT